MRRQLREALAELEAERGAQARRSRTDAQVKGGVRVNARKNTQDIFLVCLLFCLFLPSDYMPGKLRRLITRERWPKGESCCAVRETRGRI